MANFDDGVLAFVSASAEVHVHFPIDKKGKADISCIQCPYLSSNERMCQLNKEPVAYPRQYVGAKCPLKEIEK